MKQYVLRKKETYITLGDHNAVKKTADPSKARQFSLGEAQRLLNYATSKTKGFSIISVKKLEKAAGKKKKAKQKKKSKKKLSPARSSEPKEIKVSKSLRDIIYRECGGRCGICGRPVSHDAFPLLD